MASQDRFGLKVRLSNGNIASRVLPIRIYDLDPSDSVLFESVIGGVIRSVDLFIYRQELTGHCFLRKKSISRT